MSHFAQIKSSIKSVDALVNALIACGVNREWIEVHKTPQPLLDLGERKTHYRWKDAQDPRFKDCDKAHVIVRAKHLDSGMSSAHNDLGFYVDGDNSVSFICEYTRAVKTHCFRTEDGELVMADKWLTAVKHRYQYEAVKKEHPYQEVEREFIKTPKGQKQRLVIREG